MSMRCLLFLFLTTSSVFAQGGMFGFRPSPCSEGGSHDAKLHQCLYCPVGTQLDTFSPENKRCIGIPLVGNPCPRGKDVQFDDEKNLCIYCSEGYTFSFDHKHCYQ